VARDLAWGKISPTGAATDYGVVLTGAGKIDEPASDTLRATRRAARPTDAPFFDRGPGYPLLANRPYADLDHL
jgi:N-methylhydantoinase B